MNFITSHKFARACNHVFSEDLLQSQFTKLNKREVIIIDKNGDRISYISSKINLKSGESIFCKTDNLNILFKTIKKYPNITNLTLVSSQNDKNINQNILQKLPDNFKTWFAINTDIISERLQPIPLGIANYYEKNLNLDHFEKVQFVESYYSKKDYLMYISFNKSTNIKAREPVYNYFRNKPWVKYAENEKIEHYLEDLKKTNFVLCPVGNGIDTHRIWETLYAGAIPILEKNVHNLSFKNLPIYYYEDISEVTEQSLLNFLKNKKEYSLEQIDFNYWKAELDKSQVINNTTTEVKVSKKSAKKFILQRHLLSSINHFFKKINFRLRQILNLFSKKQ